jgi:plasmid stabilization system protein ParE
MTYAVALSSRAQGQLLGLYAYIANAASPVVAIRYTDGITAFCKSLSTFLERGTRRDDIRPSVRITNYRKRMVIAFTVDTAAAARSQDAALKGIVKVVGEVLADMSKEGEAVPDPYGARRYSGKFMVRIPPQRHRALALQAAESGVSLNRLVSDRLSA